MYRPGVVSSRYHAASPTAPHGLTRALGSKGGFVPTVRTHYDNLKVARDAPDLVIRAAYKSLSQRLHPDKNPGDDRAARAMAIVNQSYEVLIDPVRRRQHDEWIRVQEQAHAAESSTPSPKPAPQTGKPVNSPLPKPNFSFLRHVGRYWLLYGIVGLFVWAVNREPSPPPPGPKPYTTQAPRPSTPPYVKPTTAPNGRMWPQGPGYVQGYDRLNTAGLSSVTIDNSSNDSDVFVKLVYLGGPEAYPVRQFYIPKFAQFELSNVSAGTYDIRYRDLDSGGLSRSDSFQLEELSTGNGTQYSQVTMTLYKVANGNMQTHGLAESEF